MSEEIKEKNVDPMEPDRINDTDDSKSTKKSFLKRKSNIIIIAVAVVVLLAILGMCLLWGGKDEKPKAPKTEEKTSADTASPVDTEAPNTNATSADTQAPKTEAPKTEADEKNDLTVSINKANSWGENPVFSQLSIVITNNTSLDYDGWTINLNVGEGAQLDNGWNGHYSIKDGVLTVTNESYNSKLSAGSSTEIGVIIAGITGDMKATIVTSEGVQGEGQGSTEGQGGSQTGNNDNQNNQQGNNQSGNGNQGGSDQVAPNPNALEVPAKTTNDWLHTDGSKLYDSTGKQVWITGINWFGYNTGTNTFDGLWAGDLNTSINAIADHGFNLIRIPFSAELILQWKAGQYPQANFNQATNSYLVGMNSLQIWDYIVGQCRANGLKLMIDIHSAKTDAMGHMVNLWYSNDFSTEKYQEAIVWMAERYADDDTIIAFDLKNEPHGKPFETDKAIWNDSKDKNNWKYVAEQTAAKVLAKNPNVLIMVEGTEIYPVDIKKNGDFSSTDDKDYYYNWWGGNLRGVKDYPVNLGKYQDKLVYSPHDYGPAVYEQPWFKGGYTYESLKKDCWNDNWLYIVEGNIAPLLIGEWGGFMTEPNLTWMTYCKKLIGEYHLNHTFWCFNANSGDTGGMVKDDFTTWDMEKYNFVKDVLWQENGKFVGLDHDRPLGTAGNGISVSDAKGLK